MTYKLKRPFEVKSSNKGELTKFGPEFINQLLFNQFRIFDWIGVNLIGLIGYHRKFKESTLRFYAPLEKNSITDVTLYLPQRFILDGLVNHYLW